MEHDILERLILPLGIYSKDEVRQIAADLGIRVAKKPDSQEICFLPDGDYVSFIEKYATSLPPRGDMLFEDGITRPSRRRACRRRGSRGPCVSMAAADGRSAGTCYTENAESARRT